MGHYDDNYAYQREITEKAIAARNQNILNSLKRFRSSFYRKDIPERFSNSLEDLENWLKANS